MTSNHRLRWEHRIVHMIFRSRNNCNSFSQRSKMIRLRCRGIRVRRRRIKAIPESPRLSPPRYWSEASLCNMHRSINSFRQRIIRMKTSNMTRWRRMNTTNIHRKQLMNLHQEKRRRRWQHHHSQRTSIRISLRKRNRYSFEIMISNIIPILSFPPCQLGRKSKLIYFQ
jgi:hypothetical protein